MSWWLAVLAIAAGFADWWSTDSQPKRIERNPAIRRLGVNAVLIATVLGALAVTIWPQYAGGTEIAGLMLWAMVGGHAIAAARNLLTRRRRP